MSTPEDLVELGLANGGVPARCHCNAAGLADAVWLDGDLNSPTFGVTPLQVNAFHDAAVTANVEEHPYHPELSRVSMTFWGPPECTRSMHLSTEQARQLAARLLEAADEVEQLRGMTES